MNANQENKVSSFFKVRTFFNSNLGTLSPSAPILTTRVGLFTAELDNIQVLDTEATEDITGAFIQKNNLRNIMTSRAVNISGALMSLAASVNDELQFKKVKLFKSSANNGRDTEALYLCERVLGFAQASGVLLVPYGITALKITELQNAALAYKAMIQKPGDESAESLAAGKLVDVAIDQCDTHLRVIDGIMQAISEEFPLLFLQYQADRAIDNETGGSPSTAPDYIVILPPLIHTLILDMPYNEYQRFIAENKGMAIVQWGLSYVNNAFIGSPVNLNAGAKSNLLSSTLGVGGNFLVFFNSTPNPITVEVTIVDL